MPEHVMPVVHSQPWMAAAACTGVDPAVFFPVQGGNYPTARAVCAPCGVRGECLTYALDVGETSGIWGGLNPHQRATLAAAVPRRRTTGAPARSGDARAAVAAALAEAEILARVLTAHAVDPLIGHLATVAAALDVGCEPCRAETAGVS